MKFLIYQTNGKSVEDLQIPFPITKEKYNEVEYDYVNIKCILKKKRVGEFVEINSLKDLIKLREVVGEIIITTCMFDSKRPAIEIYNDYRE